MLTDKKYVFHFSNSVLNSMDQESQAPGVTYTRQTQESADGHVQLTTDCANGVVHLDCPQTDSRESSTTPTEFHLSTQTPPRQRSDDEKSDLITEETIKSNFCAFRPYIISCVKVTDLIVYYEYFSDGKFALCTHALPSKLNHKRIPEPLFE